MCSLGYMMHTHTVIKCIPDVIPGTAYIFWQEVAGWMFTLVVHKCCLLHILKEKNHVEQDLVIGVVKGENCYPCLYPVWSSAEEEFNLEALVHFSEKGEVLKGYQVAQYQNEWKRPTFTVSKKNNVTVFQRRTMYISAKLYIIQRLRKECFNCIYTIVYINVYTNCHTYKQLTVKCLSKWSILTKQIKKCTFNVSK